MTKREDMNAKYSAVNKRLGKTTGESKGSKPAPPASVKVRPSKTRVRVKWTKEF